MNKHIPNILTGARILMAAVFLLLFRDFIVWAFAVFLLASVTDYWDGYLARRFQLVSNFGKIMDPIADKMLIFAAFGWLAAIGLAAWWIFWVIVVRETAVTVFRFWAKSRGRVVAAASAGKIKTVLQIMTVIVMMLFLIVSEYNGWQYIGGAPAADAGYAIIQVLLILTVLLTVYSGLDVFWTNRALWKGHSHG
ncbi:MAG: CDP-diacylglycerol--glycerol-3-phosphate 3-phosphatidyltransferase [Candidatus Omnitrophota bacterium]